MTLKRTLVALGLLAPACSSPAPVAHRGSAPPATSPLHPLEPTDEATTTTEAPTTTTAAPVTTVTVSKLPPSTRGTTTTVYVLPEDQGEEDDETWWANQPGYVAPAPSRAALLACIRSYEGDYGTNTGNGYYGAYQFDLQGGADRRPRGTVPAA